MGFPTVNEILNRTRWHLNDVGAETYTNEKMIGHLAEAQDELEDELADNGIEVLKETFVVLDVPANTPRIAYTGTTPVLPTDLVDVLSVEEKADGAASDNFRPLSSPLMLTDRPVDTILGEYVWEEQELKFVGASLAVDIRIRGMKGFPVLTIPVDKTQTIPFNRALPYLAAKTAALIAANVMKDFDRAQVLHEEAQAHLNRALNRNVKAQQGSPARRIGWRRRRGRSSTISRTR